MRFIKLAQTCLASLAPHIAASALALLATTVPLAAQAAVNKCIGADGSIVFSDQPCGANQAATEVKTPSKPGSGAVNKSVTDADLPKEGAAPSNSRLQAFDMFCAESRERLDSRPDKALDNGPESDFQLAKARSDKLCDPAGRLTAAQEDKQGQIITCNETRKSLASKKQKMLTPTSSYAGDIAAIETYLAKNCPATLK